LVKKSNAVYAQFLNLKIKITEPCSDKC